MNLLRTLLLHLDAVTRYCRTLLASGGLRRPEEKPIKTEAAAARPRGLATKGISRPKIYRAIWSIALAMLCTYAFNRLGLLHGPERLALDWEMRANANTSSDIAIVTISDAEYNGLFHGHSPLDPITLRKLIDAIARSGPRAIAVDVDTSHPDFRALKPDPRWPPIIWERDVLNAFGEGDLEPSDILGGQDPALNSRAGIPVLLDDPEDKVTRLYARCIATKSGFQPSFVYAAAEAFKSYASPNNSALDHIKGLCRERGGESAAERYFIRWSRWTAIPADQVLYISGLKSDAGQEQAMPVLTGKLVLLGGTFLDVDRHYTPLGIIPGVLALASAVETELHPPQEQPYPEWALFLLEFAAGGVLLMTLHIGGFSLHKTLAIGLPIVVGLSLALSAITFFSMSRFALFGSTLIVVLIYETLEHMRREAFTSITNAH